jgi:hypothetical protein
MEEYGLAILNEGQGVAVAKNIRVKSNEFVLPAKAMFDISGSTTFEGNMYGEDPAAFTQVGAGPSGANIPPVDVNSR